jgi:Fungal specific transcription factor domain
MFRVADLTVTKCDQWRPGCGQCRNARQECPGYRTEIDLLFRNESAKIIQKYKDNSEPQTPREMPPKAPHAQCTSNDHTKKTPDEVDVTNKRSNHLGLTLQCLNQPVEDIATSFFLTSYIKGSHFGYVPTLCNSAIPSNSILFPNIQAAALATFSQELGRPDMMMIARQRYSLALKNTNNALQSVETAIRDETLASVLLLGLFETFVHDNEQKPDNWSTHASGALHLLTLRGPQQFESSLGVELFKQIGSNIRANCVQRRLRIPTELRSLNEVYSRSTNSYDTSLRFASLVEAFTDLRASIDEGSITEPTDISDWARDVDNQARDMALEMPDSMSFYVVHTARPDAAIFGSTYHIYPNHHVAQLWNTIRMTRVMLNNMIWEQNARTDTDRLLNPTDEPTAPRKDAQTAVSQMASEICGSVPQSLDYAPCEATFHPTTVASRYFLIWPLFVAGACQLCSPTMREWIIGRLKYIEVQMKIPQAGRVAEKVRRGDDLDDW